MKTKAMLNHFVGLRDELVQNRRSAHWAVLRQLMAVILRTYRLQLDYEKAKSKYKVHIEFLESAKPLTVRDRENIKEAVAVNGQIRKYLADQRRRK